MKFFKTMWYIYVTFHRIWNTLLLRILNDRSFWATMIFKMQRVIFNSCNVIFIRITMIFNDLYYREKLSLFNDFKKITLSQRKWSLSQWKVIFNTKKNDWSIADHFFNDNYNSSDPSDRIFCCVGWSRVGIWPSD